MSNYVPQGTHSVRLSTQAEIAGGVIFIILATIATQLALIHFVNTFRDFKNENRSPVQYQRQISNNNVNKLISFLKTVSIFCFFITIIFSAILRNFWPLNRECLPMVVAITISWKIALSTQYLTYILYLHQCYPEPPIGYKKSTLKTFAILIIVFAISIALTMLLKGSSVGRNVPDNDGEFPYNCSFCINNPDGTPSVTIIIFGSVIIGWDLFLSIGSIIAFSRSWNRLMVKAKANVSSIDRILADKVYKKSLYCGRKYKIIVTATSVTQLIWIVIGLTGSKNHNIQSIFAGFGFIVSMFGLMMMHPYYPNDKWYESLCCLCILCDKLKYQSNASGPHKGDEDSVDTINAVKAYFTKYATIETKKNKAEIVDLTNKNGTVKDTIDNLESKSASD